MLLLCLAAAAISAHKVPLPPLPLVKPCSVPNVAWCESSGASAETRAKQLVSELTTAEKMAQLSTYSFAKNHPVNRRVTPPVPRLGIPGYNYHTEGLHGLRTSSIAKLNSTLYPQVTALAATMNATLWHEMGRVTALEARAVHNVHMADLYEANRTGEGKTDLGNIGGFLSLYGPTINIIRDPRWGRAQESVSEDPYVNGLYGAKVVLGLQGDIPYGSNATLMTAATCKHLAAYSYEAGILPDGKNVTRHAFQANLTRQELTETYLPAFEACVKAGQPQQIMCSYNSVAVEGVYNSTPSCLNGNVLNDWLRDQTGFKGSVVADCDAVSDAYAGHHWGPITGDGGYANASVVMQAGLDAGCDQAAPHENPLKLETSNSDSNAIIPGTRIAARFIPTSAWLVWRRVW